MINKEYICKDRQEDIVAIDKEDIVGTDKEDI